MKDKAVLSIRASIFKRYANDNEGVEIVVATEIAIGPQVRTIYWKNDTKNWTFDISEATLYNREILLLDTNFGIHFEVLG